MLNDTQIRATKPGDKASTLSDTLGLVLFIQPSGARWWRFRYTFEGKRNMMSIGVYPDVSLSMARERRDAARRLLAQGIDPVDHKNNQKQEKLISQANTFEIWTNKWWEHWSKNKSERHARQVKRRLEVDVYPLLGKLPIGDITSHEVVDTVKKIGERGAVDLAKRANQTIGQVFRYAIAHARESRVTMNPANQVKPCDILEPRKKKNYARVDLKELAALLRAIDSSTSTPMVRLAVKFMALTFLRTTEMIGARWDEFDFEENQWRVPGERMKMKTDHIVPLSRQAVEMHGILTHQMH